MTRENLGVEEARLAEMLVGEAQRMLAGRADDHPDPNQLFAYLGNELHAEAEDEIRAHLVACKACSGRLLDMEPLSSPDIEIGQEAPADFAKVAAWREVSRQTGQGQQSGQGRWRSQQPRGRPSPLQIWGALAAMLVFSVALAFIMAPHVGSPSGHPAPDGLQANLPIHYLDELTRSRSFDESLIEIDADADYWALILTPPISGDGERFQRYEVELLAEDSGSILLRSEDLVASNHGALRLGIPRSLVPEGKATLRLTGLDGARRVVLETYALQIRYR